MCNENNKKKILEDISNALLYSKKVVFLFGAGASMPSGMPSSKILKENLWHDKLRLYPPEKICDSLKRINLNISIAGNIRNIVNELTFEQLMTIATDLHPGNTQDEKERKMAEWLEEQIPNIYTAEMSYFPSFAYEFVSHLASNGFIKYIINMNYDEILDRAIDNELGKGAWYKVVTLEDFERLRNTEENEWENLTKCFLIKPHGTRSMRRSCRYRIDFVQQFEDDKRHVLNAVLRDSILVLIGFEAQDPDFLNLLADVGLNRIEKLYVVKGNPESVIKRLGGPSDKICGYSGHNEIFFEELAEALYGDSSTLKKEYTKYYTKATRHFIRALIYKQVNPINDSKRKKQDECRKENLFFFERLNLLIELLIYCFKVRGLFTRKALSSCIRITSALNDYIEKAGRENPIEDLLKELEKEKILIEDKINTFESWYYIPSECNEKIQNLFGRAANKVAKLLGRKIEKFFDQDSEKEKFIDKIEKLFNSLPEDFDYDLLTIDTAPFFLPLKNIERITNRKQFRDKTEDILKSGKKDWSLYVISPSVAEWMQWGINLAESFGIIQIIINKDVYNKEREEVQPSLHFKHVSKIVKRLKESISKKGKIIAVDGVRYGLTLAFTEKEKITGKAILFFREGKASAFSPIFLKETEAEKNNSDIYKLKKFFEKMFNGGEEL